MAAESVDVRLARLEGSYNQINERLAGIEGRLASLEGKGDRHFELLITRMDRFFLWLIGIFVTSLMGLAASLVALVAR